MLASASFDKTICLFKINDATVMQVINTTNTVKTSLKFSLNQTAIFLGDEKFPTGMASYSSVMPLTQTHYGTLYFDQGWIISMTTGSRVCWVPPEHYGTIATTANGAVVQTHQGDLILLDFSAMHTSHGKMTVVV